MNSIYRVLLLLQIVLLTNGNACAQDDWELINPLPSYSIGKEIHFVSDEVGFILNEQQLLRTTDAGASWTVFDDIDSGYDMQFKDSVGVVVGLGGYVLKTVDAGSTWEQMETGTSTQFFSVSVIDTSHFFAMGHTQLYKTNDGGMSWINFTVPNNYMNIGYFVDTLQGHAFCDDGTILKTIDGGENWYETYTTNISPSDYTTVFFIDENIGFALQAYSSIMKTIDGGETWFEFSDTDYTLYDMYFVNENVAYGCGEDGAILKSTDGGLNWDYINYLFGNTGDSGMYGIYFADAVNGYCSGTRGRIMKTTDGGDTWSLYSTNYKPVGVLDYTSDQIAYIMVYDHIYKSTDSGFNWTDIGTPDEDQNLVTLDAVDDETIFVIGGYGSYPSTVHKSINGGNSWTSVDIEPPLFYGALRCMDFVDANVGYVSSVASQQTTLKTVDGGTTWVEISELAFYQLQFLDQQTGFGRTYYKIFGTVDGGENWTLLLENDQQTRSISFSDADHGMAIFNYDLMFITSDGGITWTEMNGPGDYYTKVKVYSAQIAYVLNDDGDLYRTTDGGETWQFSYSTNITDIEIEGTKTYIGGGFGQILRTDFGGLIIDVGTTPEDFHGIDVFPNPATDHLVINLHGHKIRSAELYDLTGRMQASFQNKIEAERYMIDIQDAPNGIYMLKVTTSDNLAVWQKVVID